MASSPSELSLDCKPHSYSMLLKSFGDLQASHHHDQSQTQKLEEFLSRLEEERLKIDAFKRELPLSMQLLTTGTYIIITWHAATIWIFMLLNFLQVLIN